MKKLKYEILFTILFMTIGIAAVTSNLSIKGTTPIASNPDDFLVYFANIKDNSVNSNENVVVSSNNTSFRFYTNLDELNSGIDISFEVVNSSKIYDADVELNCTESDEYLNIVVSLSNDIVPATDKVSGSLYVSLIKSYVGDTHLKKEVTCSINAIATERDSMSDGEVPNPNLSYPMLLATSSDDISMFRSDTYRESIKNITFQNSINVPSIAIESWDIGVAKNGNVMAYIIANDSDSTMYDLYIQSNEQLYANPDMSYWFANFINLDNINGLEYLDTSTAVNMDSMFYKAGLYSTVFTLNVSKFDTSNVTNMSKMFSHAGYSSTKFELDVGEFNTSKVTNMSGMFNQSGRLSTVIQLDLSNFDTSNVTDMSTMLSIVGYSNPNYTLNVSNFDTSKVTNMQGMFAYAGYSNTNFTLDITNLNTSKVTDMSLMFFYAGYNSTNFTLDVSKLDTGNVTNMNAMFNKTGYNSTKLELNLSNFDTSNVTDMSFMFDRVAYANTGFTLDVSNFDTSNVTNMSTMFQRTGYNNPNFTLDVSNFDTSNVTDMSYMFNKTGYNSNKFTLDVSNFDTSNVTDMKSMFAEAGYINPNFTLNLGTFDTSSVTNMDTMFATTGYSSTVLDTYITIRNPNTTSYSGMFATTAIQTGSKLTVNYTSETEDLVDKMIATKSSGANVFKGSLVE